MLMKTYVYIIRADTFVKIGYSRDPNKRLLEMQTGSPHELSVLALFPCLTREAAAAKEKEFHILFSTWHHRGEWFYADCVKNALKIPVEVMREQREMEKRARKKRAQRVKNPNKRRVKRYSQEKLKEGNDAGRRLKEERSK